MFNCYHASKLTNLVNLCKLRNCEERVTKIEELFRHLLERRYSVFQLLFLLIELNNHNTTNAIVPMIRFFPRKLVQVLLILGALLNDKRTNQYGAYTGNFPMDSLLNGANLEWRFD